MKGSNRSSYFNNSSFNNAESNFNVLSAALNSDNPNNTWNLNSNDNECNTNNNNRYNGNSVRSIIITKDRLLLDLYVAYGKAKLHKSTKPYVKYFEKYLALNLEQLCNDLYTRTYIPQPSSCFIIEEKKKREIFAAKFRDRIVHHLFYSYTHEMFERYFIPNTYSCIEKRGTHFGIKDLYHQILKCSLNYTQPCYILKFDIIGYFISINRNILKKLISKYFAKLQSIISHDFNFLTYLSNIIVDTDPTINCKIACPQKKWAGLPKSKSLFYAKLNCGLPIGNLTSLLFSNIYLNELDLFCKRKLKCKFYGRYVDDFYILNSNKYVLQNLIDPIIDFLYQNLDMKVHKGKTKIYDYKYGIEFLGVYLKPYRIYISNKTLKRIKFKNKNNYESVNAYLGILLHYKTYNIRKNLFFFNWDLNPNLTKILKYENKENQIARRILLPCDYRSRC